MGNTFRHASHVHVQEPRESVTAVRTRTSGPLRREGTPMRTRSPLTVLLAAALAAGGLTLAGAGTANAAVIDVSTAAQLRALIHITETTRPQVITGARA
ncbi:hypothetical protein ACFWJY_42250, partial [Streptomyces anulatus]